MSIQRSYRNCSVFGCSNSTINKPKMSFFKFPTREERREHWLKLIEREDLINSDLKHNRVCEDHFDSECILTMTKNNQLRKDSVPKPMLPEKKNETKDCQTTPDIIIANTQYRVVKTETDDDTFLTPNLTNDTRKRKIKEENCEKEKRPKTIAEESETCDTLLSKKLTRIKEQFKIKLSPSIKYSKEHKFFCLNLFYNSPKAYKLLKDTLCLPNKSGLKSMYFPMIRNIENNLMEVLKAKVDRMSDKEKDCSFNVEVMTLKPSLFYNIRHDKIYGFVKTDGKSLEPARKALVAMIRGICIDYKQPVAYALISENRNNDVYEWIHIQIRKLQEIGLNVRVFVSNLRKHFINMIKKKYITAEQPYFYVNNRKIYYVFDPPQLIKSVRDNLLVYDFHFNDYVAKWNHIQDFFEKENIKQVKIARKLTYRHVKPTAFEKEKWKLAVQVLSATVAAGMATYKDFGAIDATADGTIQLINMMNDLFDILNTSSRYGCTKYQNAYSGEQCQAAFINDMLKFFASLKIMDRKKGIDVTSRVEFIKGFQMTLNSLLLLFEDLKTEGYTHILTRRLNLDCLENFFNQIRRKTGILEVPTSWQLVSGFRKICFLNIIKAPQGGNNSADFANALLEDHTLHDSSSVIHIKTEDGHTFTIASSSEHQVNMQLSSMLISTSDYNTLDLPENNALLYICAYLLKQCLTQHNDCDLMKSYINSNDAESNVSEDERYMRYRDYCDNGGKQLSVIPQDDFVEFVQSMEKKFVQFFTNQNINRHILEGILEEVSNETFLMPCVCFPLAYCKKLYLRMRIYYTLKHNNQAFRTVTARRRVYFSVPDL